MLGMTVLIVRWLPGPAAEGAGEALGSENPSRWECGDGFGALARLGDGGFSRRTSSLCR